MRSPSTTTPSPSRYDDDGRQPGRGRRAAASYPCISGEVLFGAALAVVPALLGLPLGTAAHHGALIAVTAMSAPATGLPIRGSRLHDRMGIDALLVGLAALLWVVGEEGGSLLAAAAGLHAALTVLPGRVGARR